MENLEQLGRASELIGSAVAELAAGEFDRATRLSARGGRAAHALAEHVGADHAAHDLLMHAWQLAAAAAVSRADSARDRREEAGLLVRCMQNLALAGAVLAEQSPNVFFNGQTFCWTNALTGQKLGQGPRAKAVAAAGEDATASAEAAWRFSQQQSAAPPA